MAAKHKKRRLEAISLEELENSPSITGLAAVLRFEVPPLPAPGPEHGDASSSAPVLPAPSLAAPALSAPALEAPVIPHDCPAPPVAIAPVISKKGAPVLDAPVLEAPLSISGDANSGAPELDAPALPAPDLSGADFVYRRPVKLREARTVQDGHTHGEQLVYEALYRIARPFRGEARMITIGLRTLAPLVPISYNNCQANVRSLAAKLAIEELPAKRHNDGRTYIVYGYREILQRRKTAGLTHVIRSTRGARLLNPGAPDSGAPDLHQGASNSGAPTFNAGAPDSGITGAPELESQTNKELVFRNLTTSSSKEVAAALLDVTGYSDDNAVARILADCRAVRPDATDGEIAYFVRAHGKRFSSMRTIENLTGVLIRHLPKCFEGESFRQYRALEQQRREAEARQAAELRADAERTLADPGSSEAERQWAQQLLGGA